MLPVRRATAAMQRARVPTFTATTRRAFSSLEFDDVSPNNGAPRYPSPWNKWFPYDPVPCSPQMSPYKVLCEGGETYQFCTCGESRNQPWCESSGAGACSVNPKFTPMMY